MAAKMGIKDERNLPGYQAIATGIRNISGAVGDFHQSVLDSAGGWKDHDAGYDLENPGRMILAEVKNKHNTMNASNRQKVVHDLDTAIRQKGRGWTGYLVLVLPRRPRRYELDISISRSRRILETDGASFDELATGNPTALEDLYDYLADYLEQTREIDPAVREACKRIFANAYG